MIEFLRSFPLPRLIDYTRTSITHLTPKKAFNIINAELNYFLKKSQTFSFPLLLTVDPTNICQLKCPLCSTGQRKNLRPSRKMEEIINSGLDTLNVSLDDITPEVYNRYRIGGDFNLVVKNIKLLVGTKRKLKSKSSKIEWQFLVNKYNEHQVRQLEDFKKEPFIKIWNNEKYISARSLFSRNQTKQIKTICSRWYYPSAIKNI